MSDAYVEYSDWKQLSPEPLVSVVMPAYNHGRYLREAIEGVVRQQTTFPFELIIGDDSSNDETADIALACKQSYPGKIRVLRGEHNVGMHVNAARLVAATRGRYLAFCEGDDCWHRPDKLLAQVDVLERDPQISLVCSSWRIVSEDGTVLVPDALDIDQNGVRTLQLDDILGGLVKTVTVCTRTELARRALDDAPLCKAGRYPFSDAPMWVEASRNGHCLCLPQTYATYRLSRNSATRPLDVMDVYRFIAGSCEFDRDAIGIYSLPQGEKAAAEARIQATRKRLRALALLGDSRKVREELRWLRQLKAQVYVQEYVLYLLSFFTQQDRLFAPARRCFVVLWHALAQRRKAAVHSPLARNRPERAGISV